MLITLYKSIENKGLHYKEMWFNQERNIVVVHWGKVGFIGKSEEYSMSYEEAENIQKSLFLIAEKKDTMNFQRKNYVLLLFNFH